MEKFAFVFPGQGSQKLGMLSELAAANPLVEETFREASAVIDMDLWHICQQDSDNSLDQTEITQPVLLAASVAIWRCWQDRGAPMPELVAGHSLGEYSALSCAGVLDFADAVALVHERGKLMQGAVPMGEGKMAAIVGLDDYQVRDACDQAAEGEVVSAANYNSPGQVVIAGNSAAVDRAIELCKEAGARRALPLNVSVPSHCALMESAAGQLAQKLNAVQFNTAQIPVIQNASAELARDAEQIRANLVKQLHSPVLWVDCVNLIHAAGINRVVECGPGKVLCGLIKRIQSEMLATGSDDPASLDSAIADIQA